MTTFPQNTPNDVDSVLTVHGGITSIKNSYLSFDLHMGEELYFCYNVNVFACSVTQSL